MSNGYHTPPRFSSILIGIAVVTIALVLLCSLADVVKIVGAPFLFVPGQLGLVQNVHPEDVRTVNLSSSPSEIRFRQPGPYAVFTDDYDLLVITDELAKSNAKPWITVKSLDTDATIPVTSVDRGLRLYDTPLAKGRPIFTFFIAEPGVYEMTHPRRNATVSIVPDYTTGQEALLTLIYVVQLGLIVLLGVYLYRRRTRAQREYAQAMQQHALKRANDFWRRRASKATDKQHKNDDGH